MGSISTPAIDPSIISEAETLLHNLKTHNGGPADQAKAVRQLEKLRCRLQTGSDALLFHSQPMQIVPAINVFIEHGVFDAVPVDGTISIADLASKVGIDANILRRFILILLTQGIFTSPSPNYLAPTPSSTIFRTDQAASFYRLGTTQFPQWWKISSYLSTHTSTDAYTPTKVPYVWAQGKEGKTYYEAMEEDPVVADAWHKGMMMVEAMQPVTGMFPFALLLAVVKKEEERMVVVDVGGGRGNALVAMMKECGDEVKGKMVLQDMKEVVKGVEEDGGIEGVKAMGCDFFDEQPVKNAHVYYLRNVLHNHYDDRSEVILRQIVRAMGSDSRVLICEMILPSEVTAGSDPMPHFMDLIMLMEGGIERTEEHWGRLLDSVGLKIEKVWRSASNPVQATIEARLKGR